MRNARPFPILRPNADDSEPQANPTGESHGRVSQANPTGEPMTRMKPGRSAGKSHG